jgi:hypothetical protein
MKFLLLLLTALLTSTTAAPLKGTQRQSHLRHRILAKEKKTTSPSASPTISPTECDKDCEKDRQDELNKLNKETDDTVVIAFDDTPSATDDAIVIAFDDAPATDDAVVIAFDDTTTDDAVVIAYDDATPSTSSTAAPTFTDDFVDTPSPTAPILISEETGEPDNGIGISVDVGGDNNVVDVNVVITQNGGDVAVGGDDLTNGGGVDDYLYEDDLFVDDDAGSMSVSMRDDDFIDDNQYGDEVTTATEEMEKPEAVTDIANDDTGTGEEDGNADVIAFDDDFSTFFDNKKKDKPDKGDT